jgi:uroporphyrinogen decarboxylase
MEWTSRERVIAAINHIEPDRVPIDVTPLYDFYINLKNYLGLEIKEEVKYGLSMEVIPHPEVLKKLRVDISSVKLGSPKQPVSRTRSDGTIQDEWGVVYRKISQTTGSYFEVVHSPLADATIEDLEKHPWPTADLPGRGESSESAAKRLFEDTDLALLGRAAGSIIETPIYLMGFQKWMVRVGSDPQFAGALLDKITDVQMSFDRVLLQATARYLNIYKVSGEDLGMQTGPLYSYKMFKELFLPRQKRRWQAIRQYLDQVNPKVKIMLHSCGSIRKFIPDLVDAGIQILDPIQPHAVGMDSAGLKQDFGNCLVFHGGIDIQQVLPFGTPQEVEAEVLNRVQALASGGGYILAPAHNVQADVPPANLVAMCQAAQSVGSYPIDKV